MISVSCTASHARLAALSLFTFFKDSYLLGDMKPAGRFNHVAKCSLIFCNSLGDGGSGRRADSGLLEKVRVE